MSSPIYTVFSWTLPLNLCSKYSLTENSGDRSFCHGCPHIDVFLQPSFLNALAAQKQTPGHQDTGIKKEAWFKKISKMQPSWIQDIQDDGTLEILFVFTRFELFVNRIHEFIPHKHWKLSWVPTCCHSRPPFWISGHLHRTNSFLAKSHPEHCMPLSFSSDNELCPPCDSMEGVMKDIS